MTLLDTYNQQLLDYDTKISELQAEIDKLNSELADIKTKKELLISNEALYKEIQGENLNIDDETLIYLITKITLSKHTANPKPNNPTPKAKAKSTAKTKTTKSRARAKYTKIEDNAWNRISPNGDFECGLIGFEGSDAKEVATDFAIKLVQSGSATDCTLDNTHDIKKTHLRKYSQIVKIGGITQAEFEEIVKRVPSTSTNTPKPQSPKAITPTNKS